jgi:SET domain-containing protein
MALIIKSSKRHGRGVFTTTDIKKNNIVEICPMLILKKKDMKHIDQTILYEYFFKCNDGFPALVLGFGSLYNHSYQPNVVVYLDKDRYQAKYRALRDIKKGEELLINYNGDDDSPERDYFRNSREHVIE